MKRLNDKTALFIKNQSQTLRLLITFVFMGIFIVALFECVSLLGLFFLGLNTLPRPWDWLTLLQQGFVSEVMVAIGLMVFFYVCGVAFLKKGFYRWLSTTLVVLFGMLMAGLAPFARITAHALTTSRSNGTSPAWRPWPWSRNRSRHIGSRTASRTRGRRPRGGNLFGGLNASFRIATWNSRALMFQCPRRRCAKAALLESMTARGWT